jgi:uncharacterized protein (TIGR02118 family)
VIKLVFCLRRKSELTPEEFRRYWLAEHAELVKQHAPALRVRRYVQSHTVVDQRVAASLAIRGSDLEPYDGVAELWWGSIEELIEAGATKEGRTAGRALLEDERRFIDLASSPIFYSEEHVILDDLGGRHD